MSVFEWRRRLDDDHDGSTCVSIETKWMIVYLFYHQVLCKLTSPFDVKDECGLVRGLIIDTVSKISLNENIVLTRNE